MGIAIGLGGVLLALAAAALRWRSRSRWVSVAASLVVTAGWTLAAQFLLKPLVPGPVLAVIILGGLTLGILLTAVVGAHSSGKPDTQLAAGVGEGAGAQRLAGAGVPEAGLEPIERGHARECDTLDT
ncbi:hypothetical protein PV458_35660 [Streptomyces sp. MN03-5084-2B]|nr:hypothetical protein [Streptomyces sp. MN03-5084-2B]